MYTYLAAQGFVPLLATNLRINKIALRSSHSIYDCNSNNIHCDITILVYKSLFSIQGQETVDMGYQNPLKVKNEFINTIKLSGEFLKLQNGCSIPTRDKKIYCK